MLFKSRSDTGSLGRCFILLMMCVQTCLTFPSSLHADDTPTAADRGYQLLTEKAYLPADFDQAVFDQLWMQWPETERAAAREASPAERRARTFSYYGLVESPDHSGQGTAMGYVDQKGAWVMNCLACHGGKVAGNSIPGLPNSHFAMQTLTEDVRATKLRLGKPLSHLDVGSLSMPLGTTNGTTNAVMFGVALEALRDEQMNVRLSNPRPHMVHHDMDAPPFWNVRKKTRLYCDAMAKKNPRALLQFVLVPQTDAATLRKWEADFTDILAWIESLQPPRYPWAINSDLARQGKLVFDKNCVRCHGTYGDNESYPQKVVSLDVLGTDPVRLNSLTEEHRAWYRRSWLSGDVEDLVASPDGYVAPPLDGIWASAPYFHNGSVPTLWHVLNAAERPVIWKRSENGYDQIRGGLEVTTLDELPEKLSRTERRRYFDTRERGKSAAGHLFPDKLTPAEKQAVLEYLKTL